MSKGTCKLVALSLSVEAHTQHLGRTHNSFSYQGRYYEMLQGVEGNHCSNTKILR